MAYYVWMDERGVILGAPARDVIGLGWPFQRSSNHCLYNTGSSEDIPRLGLAMPMLAAAANGGDPAFRHLDWFCWGSCCHSDVVVCSVISSEELQSEWSPTHCQSFTSTVAVRLFPRGFPRHGLISHGYVWSATARGERIRFDSDCCCYCGQYWMFTREQSCR